MLWVAARVNKSSNAVYFATHGEQKWSLPPAAGLLSTTTNRIEPPTGPDDWSSSSRILDGSPWLREDANC